MSVQNAEIFLYTVSYNGTSIDEPVGFAYMFETDNLEIPAAGSVGPDAQAILRQRLIIEVEWIGTTAPFAPYDGTGTSGNTIIATFKTKAGGTRTITATGMRPFNHGQSATSPPFRYKQTFMYQGDMTSYPLTFA